MPWLFWIPAVGTAALVLVGYCLMARCLSLMPWNRTGPLTLPTIFRTFFSSPVSTRPVRPAAVPAGGCPGGALRPRVSCRRAEYRHFSNPQARTDMMTLPTGPTGMPGRLVLPHPGEKGHALAALCRSPKNREQPERPRLSW